MRKYEPEPGRVVISKMGRDKGRRFLVISEIDADFVMIADGNLRTMERLKKKRKRHLYCTDIVMENLRARLLSGGKIDDYEVRSCLLKEEGK